MIQNQHYQLVLICGESIAVLLTLRYSNSPSLSFRFIVRNFTLGAVVSSVNFNKGGCALGNMWITPLPTPFCMNENIVLVKPVYVKVLKEESRYMAVASFFY